MFLPCSNAISSCAGDGIASVNNLPLTLHGFQVRIAAVFNPQTFFHACTDSLWGAHSGKKETRSS